MSLFLDLIEGESIEEFLGLSKNSVMFLLKVAEFFDRLCVMSFSLVETA